MQLKSGMRVLDVGCGVGGPAREIAGFADVQIVGLNNNDFQVGRARKYTAKQGLQDQVTFVKGDFMKLSEQFGENAFDAGTQRWTVIVARLPSVQYMRLRRLFTRRRGKACMTKSKRS